MKKNEKWGKKTTITTQSNKKKKRYAKFPSIWDKATYFLFGGQEPQV